MDQESDVLKINIYGTEYPIKSDSQTDTDYIRNVAEYVDKKMREIDQNTEAKSSLKVAILAALNITDELFQQKETNKSLLNSLEGRLNSLTGNLDQSLRDDTLGD